MLNTIFSFLFNNADLFLKGSQEKTSCYTILNRTNLCVTRMNTGTRLTLRPVKMKSVLNLRTGRLESIPQSWCPLVTEAHNLLKGLFCFVEAGTVVSNLLYYQGKDKGNVELLGKQRAKDGQA